MFHALGAFMPGPPGPAPGGHPGLQPQPAPNGAALAPAAVDALAASIALINNTEQLLGHGRREAQHHRRDGVHPALGLRVPMDRP
jgi:hypothetical protein